MSIGKIGGYIRASLLAAKGDIIKRDDYGPARLGHGAWGSLLMTGEFGEPFWKDLAPNKGDLIMGDTNVPITFQPGTSGKFLKSNGPGNHLSWDDVPNPIGTVWAPVTVASTLSIWNCYPSAYFTSNGQEAGMCLHVPSDFSSLRSLKVFGIAEMNGSVDIDVYVKYAATGEHYATHQQQDTSTEPSVSDHHLFEMNLNGLVSALAANDSIGIRLVYHETQDVYILGAQLEYNRS